MKKLKRSTSLQEALLDLYVNTKSKVQESSASDYDQLRKLDPLIIVDYMRSLIELLLLDKQQCFVYTSLKQTSKNDHENSEVICGCSSAYEKLLQENESSIRNHIKLEYQLKLHNEALTTKIDELQRKLSQYSKETCSEDENSHSGSWSTLAYQSNEIDYLKKLIDQLNKKLQEQINQAMQMKSKYELDLMMLEKSFSSRLNSKLALIESSTETQKSTQDSTLLSKTSISLVKTSLYRQANSSKSNKIISGPISQTASNDIKVEVINDQSSNMQLIQVINLNIINLDSRYQVKRTK